MKKISFLFSSRILSLLLVFAFAFSSCKKESSTDWENGVYKCFDFAEGVRAGDPYTYPAPKFNVDGTNFYAWEFLVVANESALYRFENEDSLDWLKGYVLSDDHKRFDKNSKSIAWRSRNGETFDFAWYANSNYENLLPDEQTEVLRDVQPGSGVYYSIVFDIEKKSAVTWVWENGYDRSQQSIDEGKAVFKQYDIDYVSDIFWLASPWFGGTSAPPYDMRRAICIDARIIINNGTVKVD